MRGIAEWFPEKERSFATGVFSGGTTVGALISAPLVVLFTLTLGWRSAFLITGAFGFVWLVFWLALYWPPEHHRRITPTEKVHILSGRIALAERQVGGYRLLRCRKPWAIMLARAAMDPIWWFYVFWLPNYLHDVRGFDLKMIGLFAWVPFLTADVGTFIGGWFSGWLLQRGATLTRARKTVLGLGAAGTIFGILAGAAPQAWLCLVAVCVVTFSIGMWATNVHTLATDILPAPAVGTMVGLASTAAGLGGVVFTMLTGIVVDRFSYGPMFLLAGVIPVLGFMVVAFLLGDIAPLGSDGGSESAREVRV